MAGVPMREIMFNVQYSIVNSRKRGITVPITNNYEAIRST